VSLDDEVAKLISGFALDCSMSRCDDIFPYRKVATYCM